MLHARRDPWHFTALYSNTALAHELGRTHDWVVLYFHDDDHAEQQRTVVTETRGPLAGGASSADARPNAARIMHGWRRRSPADGADPEMTRNDEERT